VIEHVLSGPTQDEEKTLLQQGIEKATAAVIDLIENKPIQEVINVYNRRNSS
jgi:peptidyl-tRNA hydrolase